MSEPERELEHDSLTTEVVLGALASFVFIVLFILLLVIYVRFIRHA